MFHTTRNGSYTSQDQHALNKSLGTATLFSTFGLCELKRKGSNDYVCMVQQHYGTSPHECWEPSNLVKFLPEFSRAPQNNSDNCLLFSERKYFSNKRR